MTALRERMIQDMRLAGLAENTRNSYVQAVRTMTKFFMRPPDQLSDADLRRYFEHVTCERKVARKTLGVYLCAARFLFVRTLGRDLPVLHLVRPPRGSKLPVVLSEEEVRVLLEAVRNAVLQTLLTLIYSCGLRLSEGLGLHTEHIDGQRLELHVHGKGAQERYVPLAPSVLDRLRDYWQHHRPPKPWLFVNPRTGKLYSRAAVQRAFRQARDASGIAKPVTVHSMRHSYATHLLENGVDIRVIQALLGHRSIRTTTIYARITGKVRDQAAETVARLMSDL